MQRHICLVILTSLLYVYYVHAREFEDSVIKDLIERLDAKDAIISDLIGRVEHLEKTNANQAELIKDLELGLLELVNVVRQKDFQHVADTRTESETETNKRGEKDIEESSENTLIRKQVTLDDFNISKDRRHADTRAIAFFATLSTDIAHVGIGQDIAFDNVITNTGGAYNNHHGVFTAPVNGIYVFSATLLALGTDNDHLKWIKNGQTLCYLYVHDAGYDSSGSTIVVQLNTGDDVSIQNIDADNSLNGHHYTFISGFLLKETEPANVLG
ncbi:uncharacterized protein LOC128215078 [Mya arenaria]|uniref:uncharacterized protein LOC128215078 n=1 Tax=Mya arenaria TaxID=6604 RepID=UPI0022E1B42F|nr:uncharacterized protein LOC128215078 [Mya arenaria]